MGSKPSTPKAKPKSDLKPIAQSSNSVTTTPAVSLDKNGKRQGSARSSREEPVVDRPKDLMISYSHQDKEMMAKLRENLEKNGITVWVDVVGLQAGVDFLGKIGEAILNAKLFISLLSTSTVQSKYCQDEVALAYISQKPIFPVAINTQQEIYSLMGTGMKLQLAGIEWSFFLDPKKFDEDFSLLLEILQTELDKQTKLNSGEEKSDVGNEKSGKSLVKTSRQNSVPKGKRDPKESEFGDQFWTKYYRKQETTEWERFRHDFMKHFNNQLSQLFSSEDDIEFLWSNFKEELEITDDNEGKQVLSRIAVLEFCARNGDTLSLWESVESFIRELFAIQKVFGMDSSVRVEAVEHLGTFQSAKVIESLRDLLYNKDANVRAVASVSLAKTGNNDKITIKRLMKGLNDKDRLVREASCLALGHLQAKEAVPALLKLWRNDFISHVREAAQAALTQIGGDKVTNAMHITKVLADEIRLLTEEN